MAGAAKNHDEALLVDRDNTIARLEKELAHMRCAQTDLQEAKSILAKELHRLHLRGKVIRGQGFEGHEGGRGDSRAFKKALHDREGQDEVPTIIALPEGFSSGSFIDLPPVIVKSDRIETSQLRIRCEEAIGAGGNGRVIGGTIIANEASESEENKMEGMPLAIKAVMKSGLPWWDAEFFRETRVLKTLGEKELAPRFVTAIETPTRFLLIMVRHFHLSDTGQANLPSGTLSHVTLGTPRTPPFCHGRRAPERADHSGPCATIDTPDRPTPRVWSYTSRPKTRQRACLRVWRHGACRFWYDDADWTTVRGGLWDIRLHNPVWQGQVQRRSASRYVVIGGNHHELGWRGKTAPPKEDILNSNLRSAGFLPQARPNYGGRLSRCGGNILSESRRA